ncbi:hypothetical protein CBL_05410 [Carabus blaptoides fortunei]
MSSKPKVRNWPDDSSLTAAAAVVSVQFNFPRFSVYYRRLSPLQYSADWPLRTDAHVITGTYQAYDMKWPRVTVRTLTTAAVAATTADVATVVLATQYKVKSTMEVYIYLFASTATSADV